ncbi:MAG: VanZ family protein [Lachnospiraceae bacterium]|nr:VanZ family protein [Lachnospiraceae bacterium]
MTHSKRKIIYTVIAISLLITLYSIIFYFSAEDGESSSAVSSKVTEFICHIYYKMTGGGGGEAAAPGAALPLEAIIRKLAHFLEYMCVGFLSYSLVVLWHKPAKLGSLAVILQLVISAGLDEFHQSFIPGRYASLKDVAIDTAGGIAGILVIAIVIKIKKCWRRIK